MKRHVTCSVEKAGIEPRTLDTKAERYDQCANARFILLQTLFIIVDCFNSLFTLLFIASIVLFYFIVHRLILLFFVYSIVHCFILLFIIFLLLIVFILL
jgi:hypothetical protein